MLRRMMMAVSSATPQVGHRYWRVNVTAPDGSPSYIGFTEMQMRNQSGDNLIPIQSSDLMVAASSEVNASNASWMAADGNLSTGWLSNTASTSWWRFDFTPSSPDIRQLAIRGSFNAPDASPRDFTLQWSDDLLSWTTVLTVTGQTGWTGASDIRTFSVP